MLVLKKLLFALPFLLSLAALYQQISKAITDIYLVIDLSATAVTNIALLVGFFLLTGLFFTIFATLASSWKIVLPISALGTLSALLFISPTLGLLLILTSLAAFTLGYFSLQQGLSSYLTFQVKTLLLPSIHTTVSLLLISTSIIFYLSANTIINKEGFKLPNSITDFGMEIASQQLSSQVNTSKLQLSSQQANLLKENSKLLQQYGIDTGMLTNVEKIQNPSRQIIQSQIQELIEPYQRFIPILFTAIFFFTIYSLTSLFLFVANPLLWLIFWLLENTGFVHYEIEMREVKKLVI